MTAKDGPEPQSLRRASPGNMADWKEANKKAGKSLLSLFLWCYANRLSHQASIYHIPVCLIENLMACAGIEL